MVATTNPTAGTDDAATTDETESGSTDSATPMTESLAELGAVDTTDVVVELGVTPGECVRRLVEEHGGRLAQRDLTALVPWSAATVSRLLSTLEEERRVVRLPYGRSKVVFLPDETPVGVPAAEH